MVVTFPWAWGTWHSSPSFEKWRGQSGSSPATTMGSPTLGAWHQALPFENSGHKKEQHKANQPWRGWPSPLFFGKCWLLSKAGAQRVPDTPLEMLSSSLLGGRLSLSAANAFIFLRKKTYLSLIGCIWTNWFFSVFWTEWTLVFPLISASTSWLRCTQGDQAAIAEQKLPPFGLSYQAFPCLWQELHSYQEKK